MDINIETIENVTVITLIGNLLGEGSSKTILETVESAIAEKKINFIYDVKRLDYINSTGLSILINTLTKARKVGGEMCLVNIQEQLQKLLNITKLDSILLACNSIEEAIIKLNS